MNTEALSILNARGLLYRARAYSLVQSLKQLMLEDYVQVRGLSEIAWRAHAQGDQGILQGIWSPRHSESGGEGAQQRRHQDLEMRTGVKQ
jgi:hypothetical protein